MLLSHQTLDHVKDLMQNNAGLGLQRYEIIHLLCNVSCFQCRAPGHPSEGQRNLRRDIWHSPVLPFTQIYSKTFRKKTQQHAGPASTTTALEHRSGHTHIMRSIFFHHFCSPLPQTQSTASQLWLWWS